MINEPVTRTPVRLQPADIDALLALNDSIDWTFTATDFRVMFRSGLLVGHRDRDGRVLTCAGVFDYQSYAYLGAVMVRPEAQGRGLGRAACEAAIAALPKGRPVVLIATPEGERLYGRMGFAVVDRVRKFLSDRPTPSTPYEAAAFDIRPLESAVWPKVLELDRNASGGVRSTMLAEKRAAAERGCVLIRDGGVAGFALAAEQRGVLTVGPLAAPDARAAEALLLAACAGWTKGPVRIDVPERQSELWQALPDLGFRQADNPPVMMRGPAANWGLGPTLYGIVGQKYG